MANYKVYLSSTFRDLEAYRKAILELFKYISDDFTITAMEGYTAEDMSALQKCVSDVEKCDIYILLLANRYGHIPENNLQNPHRKSITQLEYETAIHPANKKKVLVYLADVNNQHGVEFMQDEEGELKAEKRQKLDAFRKMVSEERLSPRPFVHAADLCLLVSASLIKLILGEPSATNKKLNENCKYCCDRSTQFLQYEKNKVNAQSLFHVFVGNGNEQDSGGNLVNRCSLFSLGVPETDIISMAFAEFYNSDSFEKNKEDFFYQLHKKLLPEKDLVQSTVELLEQAIREKAAGNIVIRMNCAETFLNEDKMIFLADIFTDLHKICRRMFDEFRKRVYYFLNVEDAYEEPAAIANTQLKIDLLKKHTATAGINITFLQRFDKANKEHIETWIENYFTKDEGEKDELYDAHFADLPPSFRMRFAEKSIRTLFKRIRDQDPVIINILNT